MTRKVAVSIVAGLVVLFSHIPGARAQDTAPVSTASEAAAHRIVLDYKGGEIYPLRNLEGLDFVEPFLPLTALERGDFGRIALNTAMPAALMASAFAFKRRDHDTLREIQRWKWAGVDQKADNYPMLFGLCALSGASMLLPSPEDGDGYSFDLRLDRATVFALGMAAAQLEDVTLKPIFHRMRPNGSGYTSRPSGHVLTAAAASAFFADILRDTFHPQDESNLGLRVLEEIGCALPYLGAGYIALERVHGGKHYLTDTLLGGAIGAFTMHLFYSWSFNRIEQHVSWFDTASVSYNPDQKGLEFAIIGSF